MQALQQRRAGAAAPTARRGPFVGGSQPPARVLARRNAVRVYAEASARPLKAMISGAPAAGKGTQCAKIVEKYGLVHISVGDLLREQVDAGTAVGVKAKEYMTKGALVPDELVVEMVKLRLGQADCQQRGWLLDGYPRSASQAEAIEKVDIRPDVFLLIQVPSEILVERVVGRRTDPITGEIYHLRFKPPPADVVDRLVQRFDDTEEKCKARLETHAKNVNDVLSYYSDVQAEINGNRSFADVFASVEAALDRAIAKLNDPLEQFCDDNPEADECRVYTD